MIWLWNVKWIIESGPLFFFPLSHGSVLRKINNDYIETADFEKAPDSKRVDSSPPTKKRNKQTFKKWAPSHCKNKQTNIDCKRIKLPEKYNSWIWSNSYFQMPASTEWSSSWYFLSVLSPSSPGSTTSPSTMIKGGTLHSPLHLWLLHWRSVMNL